MMKYSFEEILEYNNLSYVNFTKEDETYYLSIPYKNTITLSFISSFISDLTNNGFIVNSILKNGVADIKAFIKDEENIDNNIETSAAYYQIKRWVDKLNKQLVDLQVEVEKMPGETKYGKTQYGKDSQFYIINPEINQDDINTIVEYLDVYSVYLNPEWFKAKRIRPVSESDFLLSKGYSGNETYISFLIPKDRINYDFEQNLK